MVTISFEPIILYYAFLEVFFGCQKEKSETFVWL